MSEQLQTITRSVELSVQELIARKRKVREVMVAVMKPNVHYGVIPGTRKISLWQPGAETLFNTFGLAPDLEIGDLSTPDQIRYRVTCHVRHVASGEVVGMGVGEASSNEEKYRWRRAVCGEEYEATLEDRRRIKWAKKRGGGVNEIKQVRTEPADVANTILKMASKRARVDGAKSTCAASDVFDQDLDDLARAGFELGDNAGDAGTEPRAKAPVGNGTALGFADVSWQRARDDWHEKGTISEGQLKRLYAIAIGNGWSVDQVKQAVNAALGMSPADLPWGDPYNAVVGIFETHGPDAAEAEASKDPNQLAPRDDEQPPPPPAEGSPPLDDSDIPF